MADKARHELLSAKETTWADYLTGGALTQTRARILGTTLTYNGVPILSKELSPDRMIKTFRQGSGGAVGDVSTELGPDSQLDWVEAALCGTRAALFSPVTGVVFSMTAGQLLQRSSGVFLGYRPGDVLTLSGFTNAANNGKVIVAARTSNTELVLANVRPNGTAYNPVNETAGASVTVTGDVQWIKAGIDRRSFTLIRHFTDFPDGTKDHIYFSGMEVAKFVLGMKGDDMITGDFSFIGCDSVASDGPFGSPTISNAPTSEPFDSYGGPIYLGGTEIGTVTELSLTLDNGLTAKHALGSMAGRLPISQASINRSNATGSITVYFENATLYDAFRNNSDLAFSFGLSSSNVLAGRFMKFVCPRIKITGFTADVSGEGPITAVAQFQALHDSVSNTSLYVETV